MVTVVDDVRRELTASRASAGSPSPPIMESQIQAVLVSAAAEGSANRVLGAGRVQISHDGRRLQLGAHPQG